MKEIQCYFNFRSPYSYLGVKKALDKKLDLKFIPLCYLPREVLESFSDPIGSPYKKSYFFEDIARLFQAEGIKMAANIAGDCNWPKVHAAWLAANDEGFGKEFMMEAYKFRWELGLNLEDKSVINEICSQIGFDSNISLTAMQDKDFDNRLKSYTKLMRENQVFGVPTFVYGVERFWGQDRVQYLLKRLKDNEI